MYILETNGMTLGADPEFAQQLSRYKNLHVRVSLKGANEEEYHTLTGARRSSYALPFKALRHLIDAGVSCNACVMASFSTDASLEAFEERLYALHPGILRSLETEHITLFPRVSERLQKYNLKPAKTRRQSRRKEAAWNSQHSTGNPQSLSRMRTRFSRWNQRSTTRGMAVRHAHSTARFSPYQRFVCSGGGRYPYFPSSV